MVDSAAPKVKKRKLSDCFKRDWQLLAMLSVPLLHIFVFNYIPMYGISFAFRDYFIGDPFFALGEAGKWVGFKYFLQFFNSFYFSRVMFNTVVMNVYGILFTYWIPIAFALLLNEIHHLKFKRVVQTVSYLPYFISAVIVVGMMTLIFGSDGVVNAARQSLGLNSIKFLGDPKYFRTMYIGMGVWQSFGWSAILFLAAITGIDQELYEAAKIDGASRLRQTWHITLPGILPTIAITLILNIGSLLSSSTQTLILFREPGILEVAETVGTYSYRQGIEGAKYAYSTAIGLFTTVVNFALLAFANRLSRAITDSSLW